MGHTDKHAAKHTDGTDDIQDATDSQKGLATDTQITKLDGIDPGADVTGSNPPQAHKATHQDTGVDEINVAGLSGVLADDQHIIDAEAVSAMGAKADGNSLNHDRPIQATESVVGIAEIATQAETDAGADDTRIVTPNKLANFPFPDPNLFLINCSQGSNLAGNQTIYCGPHGEFTTEAETQIRMPKSNISRLTINTTGNTLNTNSTLQVRKNGVAAGAAITINATTAGRQTLVLDEDFADGDLLSVELALGGTVGQRLDTRELIVTAKGVV